MVYWILVIYMYGQDKPYAESTYKTKNGCVASGVDFISSNPRVEGYSCVPAKTPDFKK